MSDNGQQHDAAHYKRMANEGLVLQLPDPEQDTPSPLDVQVKTNLELGWIDEYAGLISEMTISPKAFNELGAIVAVATAIQRKARIRLSFGDIYSNVYGCIIAPSSVYHKSSALNFVSIILKRAFFGDLLMADQVTPEGLLKALERRPEGLIVRDEIGTLFNSHRVKYTASLKQDLTRLYDGQAWRKQLSNESVTIDSPYLNIFGATTPTRFYEAVDLKDWRDGFIPRWLFVLPDGEPDFDSMSSLFETKHEQQIGKLAMQIANFSKRDVTDFELASGAHKLWDECHRYETKQAYYYDADIAAPLVVRYSTYALKFALILSAVNGEWGRITKATMQTSIDLANNYKAHVFRLMNEKSEHNVSGGKLQKILGIIVRHFPKSEGKGVPTRTITHNSNMKSGELKPCLEKLVEIGALTEEKAGRGFRYIPNVDKLNVRV